MKKTLTVTTVVYAVLVAVFLIVAYFATGGGIGWEFFYAVFFAILSLPVYISVVSVIHFIKNSQRVKSEEKTPNNTLEKILNVVSLCLSLISAVSLITIFVAIFIHIPNDAVRGFFANVLPSALLFSCIGNIVVLLNRPITMLIVMIARKRNDSITIDGRRIFIARICLLVFALMIYPLAQLIFWLTSVIEKLI